jgi:hypothetical protein
MYLSTCACKQHAQSVGFLPEIGPSEPRGRRRDATLHPRRAAAPGGNQTLSLPILIDVRQKSSNIYIYIYIYMYTYIYTYICVYICI